MSKLRSSVPVCQYYTVVRETLVDDFYANHYDQVFWSGLPGFGMRQTHRNIENTIGKNSEFEIVCEVGAGNGKHLPYVKHNFSKYIMIDLRPIDIGVTDSRVTTIQADATKLPFLDNSIDRLLSMCLLPHLNSPASALEEWRRVLKNQGQVSIFLSCDPGLLIRINRIAIMNRVMKRRGFHEYLLLNALEHRNHFASLRQMILENFKSDEIGIRRYPFNFLRSWNLNAYWIFQIKVSK